MIPFLRCKPNKELFQKEISVSFPDHGRIMITKNFIIYPSLALFHGFHASKHNTHEGIMSLFVHTSALIGGNFVLFQSTARMFT